MSDNPKWRELPIFREFHNQWLVNRGNASSNGFHRPFSRDWEKLLEDAELFSAESRNEACRDARMLAAAGLLAIRTVKHRPEYIQRVSIPLETENRLRSLFPEFHQAVNEKFDPTTIVWEPEMSFMTEARVMVNPNDLIRLNDFFRERDKRRALVPIKERSLQIFGDEKRLDLLLPSSLFRADRLTLEVLKCEIIGEPFGWKRGVIDTGKILIIENAATWHSYSRWNAQAQQYSAVVYGRGNCFAESVQHLAHILSEFSPRQRIFYFGDLDPQGLRIPIQASLKAIHIGLPPVEPDLLSYKHLIATGKPVLFETLEPASADEFDWLQELAGPVRKILESGKRIAQEHIGWEFLNSKNLPPPTIG
jgi:hypothetical protein